MEKRQTTKRIIADEYGLKLVEEHNKYYFIDPNGDHNRNEYYDLAMGYDVDGFARVAKDAIKDDFSYRDILGNLSSKKTYLGKRIFQYFKGNIEIEQLLSDKKLPYDEKLIDFVIKNETRVLPTFRSKKKAEKSIKSLRERIDPLMEKYIRYHNKNTNHVVNGEEELIRN